MKTIILEGPDRAGKSTLAANLVARGYTNVHHGVPAEKMTEEEILWYFLNPVLNKTSDLTVFDRLHLSDRIYGPVMRGGSPLTERVEILIERYVEAIGAQIIICLPPWEVVFSNWQRNIKDEYVKHVSKLRAIYDGYARLYLDEKRNFRYVRYDYTRHGIMGFTRALKELENFALPPGFVGSPAPRFLFVGERPTGGVDLPFLSTVNSSGWLNEVIDDAGFEERDLAFTNAFLVSGKPTPIGQFLQTLERSPTIIGMGTVACHALMEEKIRFWQMDHPQFFKRFRSKDRSTYVKRLTHIRRGSK